MEFQIKWLLQRSDIIYDERGFFIWRENLNSGWSVVFGCQEKPYVINFIEIYRNPAVGDVLISGNFELFTEDKSEYLVEKRFFQLLENDYSFMRMDLKYSSDSKESLQTFLVTGNVTVFEKNEIVAYNGASEDIFILETDDDSPPFRHEDHPDINLRCGSVTISVHKSKLAECSPVFAAMFTNETKETIDIDCVDAPTLQAMLTYIYTGRIDNLSDNLASNLLLAANKYEMRQLKKVCSNYLKLNLNVNNVIRIIAIGDSMEPDLKIFALKFLNEKCRFSELEATNDWKILEKYRRNYAKDILISVANMKLKNLKEQRSKFVLT
ncbi:speckle-type POZ protein-like A [Nephila pilipes]|uniref:Speckle-type POZ protein-like A n=1 Tax=Nephila pilipes TaxID=299642 RepID=A0A8X6PCX2_NEPPI|nr:speckle-type POZ protein-like A [Nephila pilipes]